MPRRCSATSLRKSRVYSTLEIAVILLLYNITRLHIATNLKTHLHIIFSTQRLKPF